MRDNFDNGYNNEDLLVDDIDEETLKNKVKKRKRVTMQTKIKRTQKLRKTAILIAAAIVVAAGIVAVAFGVGKRNSTIKENDAHNLAIAAGDEAAGDDIIRETSSGSFNGDGNSVFEDTSHEESSSNNESSAEETNSNNTVSAEETSGTESVPQTAEPQTKPTKPSVNGIYTTIDKDDINSSYAILYDCDKNVTLAGLNQYERIYPASMTKVLTLIVAVENIKDLSKTYAITQAQIDVLYKRGASRVGLERNKPVTAMDCLYGLILPSGADAAVVLACMAAGSEEKFAEMMNAKCKELGLTNSHFTNATGLHDANQYTTPYEMCKIMQYAMSNPTCAKVLNTVNYTLKATNKISPNGISVTNKALQKLKSSTSAEITIMGAKTGFTNEAMYCMASCAVKNGTKYIVVTAKAGKSSDYINDACILYTDYCR